MVLITTLLRGSLDWISWLCPRHAQERIARGEYDSVQKATKPPHTLRCDDRDIGTPCGRAVAAKAA